jgi:pilus assembly protein FimV
VIKLLAKSNFKSTGLASLGLLLLLFCQNLVAQQLEIKGSKDSTEQYSGVTYGPITSNDTLWTIAGKYRPNPDLSIFK